MSQIPKPSQYGAPQRLGHVPFQHPTQQQVQPQQQPPPQQRQPSMKAAQPSHLVPPPPQAHTKRNQPEPPKLNKKDKEQEREKEKEKEREKEKARKKLKERERQQEREKVEHLKSSSSLAAQRKAHLKKKYFHARASFFPPFAFPTVTNPATTNNGNNAPIQSVEDYYNYLSMYGEEDGDIWEEEEDEQEEYSDIYSAFTTPFSSRSNVIHSQSHKPLSGLSSTYSNTYTYRSWHSLQSQGWLGRWITGGWYALRWDKRTAVFILAFITTAMALAAELVTRKLLASNMYNYRWFLHQFFTLGMILFNLLGCLLQGKHLLQRFKKMSLSIKLLLICACLDTIHSLTLFLSLGVLNAFHTILLPQLLVPLVLMFRMFKIPNIGQDKGKLTCLVGSFLVLGGVLTSILPGLLDYVVCGVDQTGHTRGEIIANVILLLVGLVPAAASMVYKQSYLTQNEMDVYLMNFLLSCLQLAVGYILAPLSLELQFINNNKTPTPLSPPATTSPTDITSSIIVTADSHGVLSSSALNNHTTHILTAFTTQGNSWLGLVHNSWNSEISHNLFTNFNHGFFCLFQGVNGESGDTCESTFPLLPILFACYVFSVILLQRSLSQLMRSSHAQPAVVPFSLTFGILLALLAYTIPEVQNVLPSWETLACFNFSWSLCLGSIVVVVGVILAQLRPRQEHVEMNVWARLEEIERNEQLALQKQREQMQLV